MHDVVIECALLLLPKAVLQQIKAPLAVLPHERFSPAMEVPASPVPLASARRPYILDRQWNVARYRAL